MTITNKQSTWIFKPGIPRGIYPFAVPFEAQQKNSCEHTPCSLSLSTVFSNASSQIGLDNFSLALIIPLCCTNDYVSLFTITGAVLGFLSAERSHDEFSKFLSVSSGIPQIFPKFLKWLVYPCNYPQSTLQSRSFASCFKNKTQIVSKSLINTICEVTELTKVYTR